MLYALQGQGSYKPCTCRRVTSTRRQLQKRRGTSLARLELWNTRCMGGGSPFKALAALPSRKSTSYGYKFKICEPTCSIGLEEKMQALLGFWRSI